MNCLTDLANFGEGASPQIFLKSVMELFIQLFFTPQQDQQYACPIYLLHFIIQQRFPYYFYLLYFPMTTIISLETTDRLLEIIGDNCINHIAVCNNQKQVNSLASQIFKQNKDCIIKNISEGNVMKIQISNISTFQNIINQSEIAQALKKLLVLCEKLGTKYKNNAKLLNGGFFYFNKPNSEIVFYQTKSQNMVNKANKIYSAIQIYCIIAYHLYYCTSIKQYLLALNKIIYKNDIFTPKCKNDNNIDKFITNLYKKQIPSFKAAYHYIQIILQKAKQNKQSQPISQLFMPIKYEQMGRIDLSKKNDKVNINKSRQSNSMISLSSSTSTRKNRKYHKVSNHFKNTTSKLNKDMIKSTQSFYNNSFYNNASNNKGFKANTLLGSTKKSTNDNWYKQDMLLESFGNIKQKIKKPQNCSSIIQVQSKTETDLQKLLQNRQKARNAQIYQSNNNIINSFTAKNTQNTFLQKQILIKNKNNSLKMYSKNIDIKVTQTKCIKKLNICSCLYSLNQHVVNTKKIIEEQKNQLTFKTQKNNQLIKSKKLVTFNTDLNNHSANYNPIKMNKIQNYSIEQNKQNQLNLNKNVIKNKFQQKNTTKTNSSIKFVNQLFINESINYPNQINQIHQQKQKSAKKLLPISFWNISVYLLMTYYFSSENRKTENQKANKVNIQSYKKIKESVKTALQKNNIKREPQYEQKINFILQIDIQVVYSVQEKSKIRQACIYILSNEFERHKEAHQKRNFGLDDDAYLKAFLICMLRWAICITVIKNIQQENEALNGFKAEQQSINNISGNLMISYKEKLRNYQRLLN